MHSLSLSLSDALTFGFLEKCTLPPGKVSYRSATGFLGLLLKVAEVGKKKRQAFCRIKAKRIGKKYYRVLPINPD